MTKQELLGDQAKQSKHILIHFSSKNWANGVEGGSLWMALVEEFLKKYDEKELLTVQLFRPIVNRLLGCNPGPRCYRSSVLF